MSFDTHGRSMMGVTGTQLAKELAGLGLTAIGANCGNNIPDTEAALAEMHAAAPEMILIAKANAGMPRYEGSKLVYDGTPDVMGAYADRMRRNGVQLIGGCCGSGPEHIHMMRQVLSGEVPVPDAVAVGPAPAPLARKLPPHAAASGACAAGSAPGSFRGRPLRVSRTAIRSASGKHRL